MLNIKDKLDLNNFLGDEWEYLSNYDCKIISKDKLCLPGPDFIDRAFLNTNRNVQVLKSLAYIFNTGRLSKTGYLSILPVDQSIEHGAGFSFAKNPLYFNPDNIIKLAIESECNAVATTFGNFSMVARKYAHKIPFIVKINHNECLKYPPEYDQIRFGSVREAWNMGATAIGATIYFCSSKSDTQIEEVSKAFEEAHSLGLATILWCYPRNTNLKTKDADYHTSADITGQCNYIGATIQADIVKQKLPTLDKGFCKVKNLGKSNTHMYDNLSGPHPIDLCRYQVLNSFMGRVGLINSGGASTGISDLADVIKTAIINKKAGGMGVICGRKAFQRPMKEGIEILHCIQDIYLNKEIEIS